MEIIPSTDLRGGQIVRLKQGDYTRQTRYDADPIETARAFRDAGATWMHIVDLDGAKEGSPQQTKLIERMIAASGLKVQVGGGVRSTHAIQDLLAAGASRVVVGTAAMEQWEWFTQLAHDPAYADRLVLAIDAKDGIIATRGWTASSGKLAVNVAQEVSDWPLAGLLYTDVARDGMMTGPSLEQTRRIAEAGRRPVIASGGVGNMDHIRQLRFLPIWGIIIGRSIYEGTLDLAAAVAEARNANHP